MNDTTLSSDNPLQFRKTDYKIPSSEKTKTIDIKIKQKKPQYNLDTQTATIFALSSGNISKDEFFH